MDYEESTNSISDEEMKLPFSVESQKEVKQRLEARRFLTSEDFELIERLKAAQAARNKASKPVQNDEEEPVLTMDGVVAPESLEPGVKMGKMSKAQRVMRILEGRKENKADLFGHGGGLTNKEKERKKNFVMVRKGKRSVAKKLQKSNSDARWDRKRRRPQFGREKRKRRRT